MSLLLLHAHEINNILTAFKLCCTSCWPLGPVGHNAVSLVAKAQACPVVPVCNNVWLPLSLSCPSCPRLSICPPPWGLRSMCQHRHLHFTALRQQFTYSPPKHNWQAEIKAGATEWQQFDQSPHTQTPELTGEMLVCPLRELGDIVTAPSPKTCSCASSAVAKRAVFILSLCVFSDHPNVNKTSMIIYLIEFIHLFSHEQDKFGSVCLFVTCRSDSPES